MEQPHNNLYEAMDRRAIKMEAIGGDMISRYNDLVADNKTLWDQNKILKELVGALSEKLHCVESTVDILMQAMAELSAKIPQTNAPD